MDKIIHHHDGHGLNEDILITADEPGAGNASHRFEFFRTDQGETSGDPLKVGFLQFQHGPRNEPDSTPGLTSMAVLAAIITEYQGFQSGEYKCRENALVITKLQEALHWMKHRADERAARGVLGLWKK